MSDQDKKNEPKKVPREEFRRKFFVDQLFYTVGPEVSDEQLLKLNKVFKFGCYTGHLQSFNDIKSLFKEHSKGHNELESFVQRVFDYLDEPIDDYVDRGLDVENLRKISARIEELENLEAKKAQCKEENDV